MSLFLDFLWIWIVLAFGVAGGGYAWFLHDQRGRNLIIAVVLPLLTLTLGLALYYGVDTDRKSITRMLDSLIAAVERDDPDAVCRFITTKAPDIQTYVRSNMRSYKVSRAKYHSLGIVLNDATSPPSAQVQFSTVFYWNAKSLQGDASFGQAVPERIRFEIELVRTKDRSWLITNKFRHFPMRSFP
jgi:hypothetical protein